MSKADEVFKEIASLQAELTRLRQVERDYLKLREDLKALLTKIERERLTITSRGGVFYFSLEIGRYTGLSASNLEEFFKALEIVPTQSLEFHLRRGDFDAWLRSTGSGELASAFELLREESISGEALRTRILEIIRSIGSGERETIDLS